MNHDDLSEGLFTPIPNEIICMIVNYLDFEDALRCEQVCRRFSQSLFDNNKFWFYQFKKTVIRFEIEGLTVNKVHQKEKTPKPARIKDQVVSFGLEFELKSQYQSKSGLSNAEDGKEEETTNMEITDIKGEHDIDQNKQEVIEVDPEDDGYSSDTVYWDGRLNENTIDFDEWYWKDDELDIGSCELQNALVFREKGWPNFALQGYKELLEVREANRCSI